MDDRQPIGRTETQLAQEVACLLDDDREATVRWLRKLVKDDTILRVVEIRVEEHHARGRSDIVVVVMLTSGRTLTFVFECKTEDLTSSDQEDRESRADKLVVVTVDRPAPQPDDEGRGILRVTWEELLSEHVAHPLHPFLSDALARVAALPRVSSRRILAEAISAQKSIVEASSLRLDRPARTKRADTFFLAGDLDCPGCWVQVEMDGAHRPKATVMLAVDAEPDTCYPAELLRGASDDPLVQHALDSVTSEVAMMRSSRGPGSSNPDPERVRLSDIGTPAWWLKGHDMSYLKKNPWRGYGPRLLAAKTATGAWDVPALIADTVRVGSAIQASLNRRSRGTEGAT